MKKQTVNPIVTAVERHILILVFCIAANLGILVLIRLQINTIKLLKQQEIQVSEEQRILSSSEQIYATYKGNIEAISNVFPDEEQVLVFLKTLEAITKENSSDYSIKFGTLTPLAEGENLYLLFSVSLKTDPDKLDNLLSQIETLPYMTRVLSLVVSWPDQKVASVDASFQLKLYVKNPFSSR